MHRIMSSMQSTAVLVADVRVRKAKEGTFSAAFLVDCVIRSDSQCVLTSRIRTAREQANMKRRVSLFSCAAEQHSRGLSHPAPPSTRQTADQAVLSL